MVGPAWAPGNGFMIMSGQNTNTVEPTIFLTRKLWKYAGNMRPHIIVYTLMFVASNCLGLLTPIIVGMLISRIDEKGVNGADIYYLLMLRTLQSLELGICNLSSLYQQLGSQRKVVNFMFYFQAFQFEHGTDCQEDVIFLSTHCPRW